VPPLCDFLIAEAQTGNLHVCQSDERVVLALRNLDGNGKRAFYDRAVRIVAKFSRVKLSVRIVEDPLVGDGGEGHDRIIL